MLRRILFLLPLALLSACGPIATPDAYQLALGNIQAQSTIAASQVLAANLTAEAYAPTREAAGTATERAWTMVGWTATASVDQTATAGSGTATQQARDAVATQRAADITATVDAAAASAQATALHGQAVSVELAIERERMMNKVQATAPWAALGIILAVLIVIALRWSKVRPIQRDSRGDAPLLIIDGSVYDADRNPYPLLDLSGKKASIPALTATEIQSATTARDQMIDLATRGIQGQANPQHKALAQKTAAQNILPAPPSPIQVISPEQARPLLGNAINGIVRDAIDADISNEDEGEPQ